MTDSDLQIIIDGMRKAAELNPVDPVEAMNKGAIPDLNKRFMSVDGIALCLQFSITKAPTQRLIEVFSVGPDNSLAAIPEPIVDKLVSMIFRDRTSVQEIPAALRQRVGIAFGANRHPSCDLNRQFVRILS